MIKLIRSTLTRIIKSPTFWICSAMYLLYGLIISSFTRHYMEFIEYPTTNLCLSGSPITGMLIMIYLNVIMGADFKNNAIRNKILMGHTKGQIYTSNVLAFSLCAIVTNLIYLCITLSISPIMYGLYELNKYLTIKVFAKCFVIVVLFNILTVTAYVSLYTFITMTFKNTVASLVCGVLLESVAIIMTLVFWQAGADGNDWAYSLINFHPTGMDALITSGMVILDCLERPLYFVFVTAYLILISAIPTTVGLAIFKKIDIK